MRQRSFHLVSNARSSRSKVDAHTAKNRSYPLPIWAVEIPGFDATAQWDMSRCATRDRKRYERSRAGAQMSARSILQMTSSNSYNGHLQRSAGKMFLCENMRTLAGTSAAV